MYANHPAMAKRWSKVTSKGKKLPERVGTSMGAAGRLVSRIVMQHLSKPVKHWTHMYEGPSVVVKAFHPETRELVGLAHFQIDGKRAFPMLVRVVPGQRRKGVASDMYQAVKDQGYAIPQSTSQTVEGKAFRRGTNFSAMSRVPESDAEELRDELRAREDYLAKARATGDARFREIADDERDHAKILRRRMRGKTGAAAGSARPYGQDEELYARHADEEHFIHVPYDAYLGELKELRREAKNHKVQLTSAGIDPYTRLAKVVISGLKHDVLGLLAFLTSHYADERHHHVRTKMSFSHDSYVHQIAVTFDNIRGQREFEEQWLGKPGVKVLRRPGKVVVKLAGTRLSAVRDVMASALSAGGEIERRGALPRGDSLRASIDDPGLVHTVTRRRELWLRGAGTGAACGLRGVLKPIIEILERHQIIESEPVIGRIVLGARHPETKKIIGKVYLDVHRGKILHPEGINVDPAYQRMGVASAMLDHMTSRGWKIKRGGVETDAGKAHREAYEKRRGQNFELSHLGYGRPVSAVFQNPEAAHRFLQLIYKHDLSTSNIQMPKLKSRLWEVTFKTRGSELEVRRLAAEAGGAVGGEATPSSLRKRLLIHKKRGHKIAPSANSFALSSMTSAHPIHLRARFPGPAKLVEAGSKLRRYLGKHVTVERAGPRELSLHVTMPPRPPEIPRHVHNHGSFIQFLRDRIEALGGVVSGLVDSTVANSFALAYACGPLTGWITPTGAHRPNAQHHHIENLTDILNKELRQEVPIGTDSFRGIKQGFAHVSHDGTQLFVTCMEGALQRVNTFLRRWVTKDQYPSLERIVMTVFNKRGEHRQTMRDVGMSHAVAFAYGPRVLEPVEDPVRNRRDIARVVAQQLRVTQTSAHPIIDRALAVITDTLIKEGRVELRGFGVFKLVKKKQRWRNDPNRGNQPLLVPDRVAVVFTPSKLVLQRLHRPESVPNLKPLPLLDPRKAPRQPPQGKIKAEPFYGY